LPAAAVAGHGEVDSLKVEDIAFGFCQPPLAGEIAGQMKADHSPVNIQQEH